LRAKVIVSESMGSKSGWGDCEGGGGRGRFLGGKNPLMSSSLRSVGVCALGKEGVFGGSFPKASFLAVQMSLVLALARKRSHDFLLADWMD
jgi:hypothetical protein